MGDIIIAGVPASLVIVSLVQAAKTIGMHRKFAPLLSITLGIVIMLSMQVVRALPWLRAWWEAIGAGIMLGLTACGLYSGGKAMITSHSSGKRLKETETGEVVESVAHAVHVAGELTAPKAGPDPRPTIGPGD